MSKFTLFKGTDRQYYWNFKASNGEKLCHSEGYTTRQAALLSIAIVKRDAADAAVDDLTGENQSASYYR